jgi:hypothetical protein
MPARYCNELRRAGMSPPCCEQFDGQRIDRVRVTPARWMDSNPGYSVRP